MNAEAWATKKDLTDGLAALKEDLADGLAASKKDLVDGLAETNKRLDENTRELATTNRRVENLSVTVFQLYENVSPWKRPCKKCQTTRIVSWKS